jgi:ParB-like chromosome segregation protein Spo0J
MIMKIKDFKLNKNNPRFIRDESFEKLKKSINDFPQMLALKPIIIDENNIILCGNMRYRALKELGETDCHVVIAEGLTEEQKKELLIKDNLSMGEWDYEILGNFWDADKLIEWGLEIPSYEGVEEDEQKIVAGKKTCPHCGCVL